MLETGNFYGGFIGSDNELFVFGDKIEDMKNTSCVFGLDAKIQCHQLLAHLKFDKTHKIVDAFRHGSIGVLLYECFGIDIKNS